MNEASPDQQVAPTYRSGTAARLAGIPVDTLRMWERRYQIVSPQVSERGHRRYAAEDVSRLALIKGLVDLGHPIGTLARLPLATLREMRAVPVAASAPAQPNALQSLRVAVVGESLAVRAAAAPQFPRLQVVAVCADRTQAAAALRGVAADVLAFELPALREDAVDTVDALAATVGAPRAVVAYRFGTEAAVRELRRRGHVVVHAPLDLGEIESLSALSFGTREPATAIAAPAPRLDEHALARLAQTSGAVRCECPRHVVDLLLSLGAFERYSAECENRSRADAELHRYLGRVAGAARALFEEALVRVAQAEGISLTELAPPVPG